MEPLYEACDLLDQRPPMFGWLVNRCDSCGQIKVIQIHWVMTYAGAGVGAYYGPTPPEYDAMCICAECVQEEIEAERAMEEAYAREAEEEERAMLAERIQDEERMVQG